MNRINSLTFYKSYKGYIVIVLYNSNPAVIFGPIFQVWLPYTFPVFLPCVLKEQNIYNNSFIVYKYTVGKLYDKLFHFVLRHHIHLPNR